jgi:curved DNA-binding protein CbpA
MPPSFRGALPDAPAGPQSSGLDVLTQNTGEMARRVHARDLGAHIVTAVFRVVKLSTLHSIDNQAMVRQVEETVALVNDYGQRTERNVSILFAHGSVFVGGQLLRANRGVYEGALELGEILRRVGAAEIGVMRDARAQDFYDLAAALADALRSSKPKRVDRPSPRIRLRSFNAAALGREGMIEQRLEPAAQVARTYASAIVIMRRFFEELRRGKYDLPQRVKRVAQRLVDLSSGETPAFLGVTAARNANHDQAGRAVNTAILSLAMARQITSDIVMLARIAMAALLYDAGRARIAGVVGEGGPAVMPQLSEQQANDSPAATAVVLTALGRVNEPGVMRTVMAYEAHWVKRRASLGALYRGLRQPSLQARIVAVAQTFNDMLTPSPGVVPPSADEAIARIEKDATEPADRTALRLLVGALGLFPTGTLVELSTGEVAVVVQTPQHPSLYSQPRVRVVLDDKGGAVQRPVEIDLTQQRRRPGDPLRHVRRVVDDDAAAGLRALGTGRVLSSDISGSAPGATAGSGIRVQGAAQLAKALTPPVSASSSLVQSANSPVPTLASQFTQHEGDPPPGRRIDVQVQKAPPLRGEQAAYSEESGVHGQGARALSGREQPHMTDPERDLHKDKEAALSEPFGDAPLGESADAPPTAPPTAEGTLAKTPFVHLLVYMLDQRLTGTTVFHASGGLTHAIFFYDGAPAKVRTGTMVAPLDRVLLEQGLLDEATLRATLVEISKRRVLHGRHLVMKELLAREAVLSTLRLQLLRKVTFLFELPPETRYAYYADENLLALYGGPELTPCEPLAAIMAGIRLRASDPLVDATLLRITGRPLALHVDAETKRFQLQRDERAVVDLIRARPMPLAELLGAGVAQERVVRLTIYALALTRHLDLGGGRSPVGIHRDWTTISSAEPAQGATRESGPNVTPGLRSAAPQATPSAPQARTRTAKTTTESQVRVDDPASPRGPEPNPPVRPSPARVPQANVVSRPTTRIARAGSTDQLAFASRSGSPEPPPVVQPPDSEAPGPSSAGPQSSPPRSAGGPRSVMPNFELDQSPVSSPTTRMPRVASTSEFFETADDTAPSSRNIAPSSRRAPPSSHNAFDRAAAGAALPLSPAGVAPGRAAPRTDLAAPRTDLAARRAEIERRAQSIDGEDYFQMLGVDRAATSEQLRNAYFALARSYHPDRLPSELADLKAPLGRVFARFNDAYQTLSDAAKRADYLERLQQGTGAADDDEKLARFVDAALECQKAEVLLKKNDLAGAEALATRAVEADPEQPEYRTLLTWIKALRRGDPPGMQEGMTSAHFDDLIQSLEAVLEKEPQYERALYYRGVLHKRAGRYDKAIRDFRLVAELNPKNLDAVREVRLHEMRRRTGPTPAAPEGGGLFGKFFKR